jgi:gliding motility-associated-like protein
MNKLYVAANKKIKHLALSFILMAVLPVHLLALMPGVSYGSVVSNFAVGELNASAAPAGRHKSAARPLPSSGPLHNLVLSEGVLSPHFMPSIHGYTAYVRHGASTVTITPTTDDPDAEIMVNANLVSSGSSITVLLNEGLNYIDVDVTAPDGGYTIAITRLPLTSNNKLSALSVNNGGLSPYFNPAVHNYTAPVVSNVTSSVILSATADDFGAFLKVNGVPVISGSDANVPLNVGNNTIVVTVLAPDSSAINTYTVSVKRESAGDATLETQRLDTKSLITKLTTSSALNTYSTTVSGTTTSVKLTVFATDPSATLTVNGAATASGEESVPLALNSTGATIVTTVVTAPNGAFKTYQLTITKTGSSDANLLSQKLDTKSALTKVTTSSAINTYTASVSMATTSVSLTAVTSDTLATMEVNGTPLVSGTQSEPIALNPTGTTTITTVVTAPDGTTTKTYKITISKTGAGDANLTSLSFNTRCTLVKQSSSGTLNTYTTSIDNNLRSLILKPVASDASANITVNGLPVASGSLSPGISINRYGPTKITTIVTAAGGATKTYVVIVNDNGSNDASLTKLTLSTNSILFRVGKTDTFTSSVSAATTKVRVAAVRVEGIPNKLISVRFNGESGEFYSDVDASLFSHEIPLNPTGTTTITVTTTANDRLTTKTYSIIVSKNGSNDAAITKLVLNPAVSLTSVAKSQAQINYIATVSNATTSIKQTAYTRNANSTIKVNGITIAPGVESAPIALNPTGTTDITTVVTAEDGTTKTYVITIAKASSFIAARNNHVNDVGVTVNDDNIDTHPDVIVRQAVSPNGDGINDALTIDGLAAYPDNKVSIMDKGGVMVYEQKGYDGTGSFDGRTATGKRLQQGTYFYSVEYRDEKGLQRKTGYLVLKY